MASKSLADGGSWQRSTDARRSAVRLFGCSAVLAIGSLALAPAAQSRSLADRVREYVARFEQEAAAFAAEERYRQQLMGPGRAPAVVSTRLMRSDYVLVKPAETSQWLGYRDVFEVDGEPVRERDTRLMRLLEQTSPDSHARAEAFAREGSRFNLGPERTVNTPLMPLQLLSPKHEGRIRLRSGRVDRVTGLAVLRVDEPRSPTIIRTPEGFDVWSRGEVTVRPADGAIVRATLRFQFSSTRVRDESTLEVEYGEVPGATVLMPVRMTERLAMPDGNSLRGEATYSNYRRFQTSTRIR